MEPDKLLGLIREFSEVVKYKPKVQKLTAVSTKAISNQEI